MVDNNISLDVYFTFLKRGGPFNRLLVAVALLDNLECATRYSAAI